MERINNSGNVPAFSGALEPKDQAAICNEMAKQAVQQGDMAGAGYYTALRNMVLATPNLDNIQQ